MTMDLHALISTNGYWVVVLGCIAEGETVLLLAGFAASQGHLNIFLVMAIAALSGFIGDQMFFWIGRKRGGAVLKRFPSVERQVERMNRLIERYQSWVIVGVRFAYGLRIAGPIIIGTSRISAVRFMLFNAFGAVLWATLIGGMGYLFGEAATAMLGNLHNIEIWLLLGLFVAAMLFLLLQRMRARRHTPSATKDH